MQIYKGFIYYLHVFFYFENFLNFFNFNFFGLIILLMRVGDKLHLAPVALKPWGHTPGMSG